MSASRITLPAFAKINWVLRVLGRRPDNLHEIHTIFQTITLCDQLTFEDLDEDRIELACDASDIPVDESNLVHGAATALRRYYNLRRGARIYLEKRIPAMAGLGGGSSDAAVTLLGLTELWNVAASKRELAQLGAHLGADVPFFLTGGTALGTGLGTEITPFDDIGAEHLLVVTPGVQVSTAKAYQALKAPALTKENETIILPVSRANAHPEDSLRDILYNDFEPVVFDLQPEIRRAKNLLLEAGARGALLAGSGSSVFGIFDSREARRRAQDMLGSETNWRIYECATLARIDYRKAFDSSIKILAMLS